MVWLAQCEVWESALRSVGCQDIGEEMRVEREEEEEASEGGEKERGTDEEGRGSGERQYWRRGMQRWGAGGMAEFALGDAG